MNKSIAVLAILGAGALALGWRRIELEGTSRPKPSHTVSPGLVEAQRGAPVLRVVRGEPPPARFAPEAPEVRETQIAKEGAAEPARVSDDFDDYREYLQLVFEQDARDRGWEVASESRLRSGLAKFESNGVRVQSVECRASLCRAVLAGTDGPSVENAKLALTQAAPWDGPGLIVSAPATNAGDFRVMAFFGREGRELPDG